MVDCSSDVFSLGLSFAKVFAGTQLAGHRGAVTGAIEAIERAEALSTAAAVDEVTT